MDFSYKIAELRREKGWTQEDLAEKMDVTRQSVSKWEGGVSIPDLEKIIKLSELFNVSTDYLIKDQMKEQKVSFNSVEVDNTRKISSREALEYIKAKSSNAKSIAFATFLCILSPLALMNLSIVNETNMFNITENMAIGIGLIVMFLLAAVAVSIFIYSDFKLKEYNFIEKEPFKLNYGVKESIKNINDEDKIKLEKNRIVGIFLCIVSLIPLFISIMINEDNDSLTIAALSVGFIVVGIGVMIIIISTMKLSSYKNLITEGEIIRKKEEEDSIAGPYWSILVAIFLGYSFITGNWEHSWIIFVVGALLMPFVLSIVKNKKKSK